MTPCIYGPAHSPNWNGVHYTCLDCDGHCCRAIWPHSLLPSSGERCY